MNNVIQFPGTDIEEAPMWIDDAPYEPMVIRVQLPEPPQPNMAHNVVVGVCWMVIAFVVTLAVMA